VTATRAAFVAAISAEGACGTSVAWTVDGAVRRPAYDIEGAAGYACCRHDRTVLRAAIPARSLGEAVLLRSAVSGERGWLLGSTHVRTWGRSFRCRPGRGVGPRERFRRVTRRAAAHCQGRRREVSSRRRLAPRQGRAAAGERQGGAGAAAGRLDDDRTRHARCARRRSGYAQACTAQEARAKGYAGAPKRKRALEATQSMQIGLQYWGRAGPLPQGAPSVASLRLVIGSFSPNRLETIRGHPATN
jgi:hypothetical protein